MIQTNLYRSYTEQNKHTVHFQFGSPRSENWKNVVNLCIRMEVAKPLVKCTVILNYNITLNTALEFQANSGQYLWAGKNSNLK